MCGIVAFIGKNAPNTQLLSFLCMKQDTRGGDNMGFMHYRAIAGTKKNDIVYVRGEKRYTDLIKNPSSATFEEYFKGNVENRIQNISPTIPIFLGHSRKGSVGTKDLELAHPHRINGHFFGVHNGTITNWEYLLQYYGEKLKYENETDAEFKKRISEIKSDSKALFTIIERGYYDVLEKYDGAAVLVWTSTKEPNALYYFKGRSKSSGTFYQQQNEVDERPLHFWATKDGLYFSSEAEPLYAATLMSPTDYSIRREWQGTMYSTWVALSNKVVKLTKGGSVVEELVSIKRDPIYPPAPVVYEPAKRQRENLHIIRYDKDDSHWANKKKEALKIIMSKYVELEDERFWLRPFKENGNQGYLTTFQGLYVNTHKDFISFNWNTCIRFLRENLAQGAYPKYFAELIAPGHVNKPVFYAMDKEGKMWATSEFYREPLESGAGFHYLNVNYDIEQTGSTPVVQPHPNCPFYEVSTLKKYPDGIKFKDFEDASLTLVSFYKGMMIDKGPNAYSRLIELLADIHAYVALKEMHRKPGSKYSPTKKLIDYLLPIVLSPIPQMWETLDANDREGLFLHDTTKTTGVYMWKRLDGYTPRIKLGNRVTYSSLQRAATKYKAETSRLTNNVPTGFLEIPGSNTVYLVNTGLIVGGFVFSPTNANDIRDIMSPEKEVNCYHWWEENTIMRTKINTEYSQYETNKKKVMDAICNEESADKAAREAQEKKEKKMSRKAQKKAEAERNRSYGYSSKSGSYKRYSEEEDDFDPNGEEKDFVLSDEPEIVAELLSLDGFEILKRLQDTGHTSLSLCSACSSVPIPKETAIAEQHLDVVCCGGNKKTGRYCDAVHGVFGMFKCSKDKDCKCNSPKNDALFSASFMSNDDICEDCLLKMLIIKTARSLGKIRVPNSVEEVDLDDYYNLVIDNKLDIEEPEEEDVEEKYVFDLSYSKESSYPKKEETTKMGPPTPKGKEHTEDFLKYQNFRAGLDPTVIVSNGLIGSKNTTKTLNVISGRSMETGGRITLLASTLSAMAAYYMTKNAYHPSWTLDIEGPDSHQRTEKIVCKDCKTTNMVNQDAIPAIYWKAYKKTGNYICNCLQCDAPLGASITAERYLEVLKLYKFVKEATETQPAEQKTIHPPQSPQEKAEYDRYYEAVERQRDTINKAHDGVRTTKCSGCNSLQYLCEHEFNMLRSKQERNFSQIFCPTCGDDLVDGLAKYKNSLLPDLSTLEGIKELNKRLTKRLLLIADMSALYGGD